MTTHSQFVDAAWVADDRYYTLAELTELSALSAAELHELVAYGALVPQDAAASPWRFTGTCLLTIQTVCRLRGDFELELHGVALVVTLLERIRELETQLGHLRVQLPAGGPAAPADFY